MVVALVRPMTSVSDYHGGEPGSASQCPPSKREVSAQIFDRLDTADCPERVLDRRDAAEATPRRRRRGRVVQPPTREVLGLEREVQPDFVIQVTLGGATQEDGSKLS